MQWHGPGSRRYVSSGSPAPPGGRPKAARDVRIAHLVIGGDVAGGQLVALQLARGQGARTTHGSSRRARAHSPSKYATRASTSRSSTCRERSRSQAQSASPDSSAQRAPTSSTPTRSSPRTSWGGSRRGLDERVSSYIHIGLLRPVDRAAYHRRLLDNATARLAMRSSPSRKTPGGRSSSRAAGRADRRRPQRDRALSASSPPEGRTVVEVARLALDRSRGSGS